MKKAKAILWGLVIVAVGVIVGLKTTGIAEFDIFFDGWWTLILIVAGVIEFFTSPQKISSLVTAFIGVFLLLCCRDIIDFSLIWKLALPIAIVAVGVKIIYDAVFKKKSSVVLPQTVVPDGIKKHSAYFSGNNVNYSGKVFGGADFRAVFGGVDCDLRGALIENDCTVNAVALFGGVDIFLPEGVNVEITSTSFFGGASSEKHINLPDNPHTVYVKAFCLFGGVDAE